MKPPNSPTGWQAALVLSTGILAISTAAILVRLAFSEAFPFGIADTSRVGFSLVLAASRLALAALLLVGAGAKSTPLSSWKVFLTNQTIPSALRYAGAAGIALAVHFATWITSLSYTSIAASTTLVTTNPIWVALLSWVWLGEKPTRSVAWGMGIALVGGILIGLGETNSTNAGTNPLLGNGLALVGAWAASLYFLLGRAAQKEGLSIGSYATVAYSVAAIALLPLPWLFGTGYGGYSLLTYGYIFGMALLPQLIGHTSLNWAIRWISPTLVALVILVEPVLASLFSYLLFKEIPGAPVVLGALVVLTGVAIAAISPWH